MGRKVERVRRSRVYDNTVGFNLGDGKWIYRRLILSMDQKE